MLTLAAVCMNAAVSSQVSSHLPKVKKQPLMLEAPAEAFIWRPLPAMVEAAGRAAPLISLQPLPPISSMPAVGHGERDPSTPSTAHGMGQRSLSLRTVPWLWVAPPADEHGDIPLA